MSQAENSNGAGPRADVTQVVENLFRHEAGKMVATLTGIFGLEHLRLAEDVVQEALSRALQTWPYYGVPQNPAAWIMRASRNLALDTVRRQKVFREKQADIVRAIEREPLAPDQAMLSAQDIGDDRLRLMFVCSHPSIPEDAQAALALKTLCGFSIREIARAFLTTEAAIAKRLTRARQKIREARVPFELPSGPELGTRLEGVLQSLYLLFNEGYKASSGNRLVREELCHEAIRLTGLLAEHPAGNKPQTHALLALMLLNAARLPARLDANGNLALLNEQNRSHWDQGMIARGMFHLARSSGGEVISPYHLQAGIAACHCAAKDYVSTDWRAILSLYDRLMEFDDSPVIALNRAVALAKVKGPKAGIEAIATIRNKQSLDSYYLFYAVLGELEAGLQHSDAAVTHFRKSLELAEIKSEKAFLSKRLRACEKQAVATVGA